MTASPTLVWFRLDLRVSDNPALHAAAERGAPVVALFLLDDAEAGAWGFGGAQRWWLHGSLASLAGSLGERGVELVLRRGRAAEILPALAGEIGAGAVYWNRCYEPWRIARDRRLKQALAETGVEVESFNAALLHEPWAVQTLQGGSYGVFTPFWRALQQRAVAAPSPAPSAMTGLRGVESEVLADWGLLPAKPDWAGGLRRTWTPGEKAAEGRLGAFLQQAVEGYAEERDRPGLDSTSRLSPHLHFGEIGPRQVWAATRRFLERQGSAPGKAGKSAWKFLAELAWREFSYHLLFHHPALPEQPWRPQFAAFPWSDDEAAFAAWCHGRTGYPVVDAGMRQLWATGWLHNRVRMIVASFLVKDLLIPWQRGEAWFWDTLVDADLASNAASWQWVSGCGADAAPYFRIFNPVLQGEKFDPGGDYVRRWLPELAALPDSHLHRPWEAPAELLRRSGIVLGRDYPLPLVDHRRARERALAAFEEIRKEAAT
ncbi:deoxyribodipyrimidine photo-lyase [Tistlia consotensis]|uniref:Deoxyribodipyrimidine photo-lyase n=1 Tax=Tistlia consotensis USBA 355 TaxID=560819 RepID=A0A1Y6C9U7_9PROT|nr:deoxyribodipyrimidine photo-lyase [Tistlia consotensis]SMF53516.1 deoxyribodipyrimidine photo-lyase [Tistlia consotensis USBA 355]SNR85643.1 deoxyribodipyrimidine photo-lyase [Tistlia consotensis]